MRAERERRATILTAEGTKQAQILNAEGHRQAAILAAEGDAKAAILRADGESQAIHKVFEAIHKGRPDQNLLAYQYLQTLPKLAEGSSNKLWIIPSELGEALKGVGSALGNFVPDAPTGNGMGHGPAKAASPAPSPAHSPTLADSPEAPR